MATSTIDQFGTHPAPTASPALALGERIRTREARAAVVGLGYVGLPLSVELARAGFSVTGIDTDANRIGMINRGESYIADVKDDVFAEVHRTGRLAACKSLGEIESPDVISICVPTPLRKTREPDLSYVLAVAQDLACIVRPGMLVILESTTYPGTTSEAIVPVLEQSGLKVGKDFFVCFSPERVDPGNPESATRTIPKVIGGETDECIRLGSLFYGCVMDRVVPVSSTRVAEMVKLLENTFRMINIGLANEMALLCDRMGIDVWEVIEAASTKPFGFMPFYPGPGLGGHCIPIDPHYLSWKVKQFGQQARFIDLAEQVNRQMPEFVVRKIQDLLNEHGKPVKGSRIRIIGVAYKKNVADVRESPALDIIASLHRLGADVTYVDPFIPEICIGNAWMQAESREAFSEPCDCAVIVTDHDAIDYDYLLQSCICVVDTRNRLKGMKGPHITRI